MTKKSEKSFVFASKDGKQKFITKSATEANRWRGQGLVEQKAKPPVPEASRSQGKTESK